jgi:hypothetical protein
MIYQDKGTKVIKEIYDRLKVIINSDNKKAKWKIYLRIFDKDDFDNCVILYRITNARNLFNILQKNIKESSNIHKPARFNYTIHQVC